MSGKTGLFLSWGMSAFFSHLFAGIGICLSGVTELNSAPAQETGESAEGDETNRIRWMFRTNSIVDSSPAIGRDGTIYVGSDDYRLYAVNPDGSLRWSYETRYRIFSSPAVALNGTIYVGSEDRNLYALNSDGTLKWKADLGKAIVSSPSIGMDDTVYIHIDGRLIAFAPTGQEKWRFLTDYLSGSNCYSSPVVGEDGTIYVGSVNRNFYAVHPDGTLKWRFPTGNYVETSAAIGEDGTIYIGSGDRRLYAINPDGTEKWRFQTSGYIDSSAAIGEDGMIYIASLDAKLYALRPDGTLAWELATGGGVDSCPTIGPDGTLYIGSKDRHLYAIEVSAGLAEKSWPKFKFNARSTGTLYIPVPGDANRDGKVDIGDLGVFSANYGCEEGAEWETGDFNGDGCVDVADLGMLASHYGFDITERFTSQADSGQKNPAPGALPPGTVSPSSRYLLTPRRQPLSGGTNSFRKETTKRSAIPASRKDRERWETDPNR